MRQAEPDAARRAVRFSLILGTVGRTWELDRSLAALDAQTQRGFELIVVDQNRDERLAPILARYERRFPILHLKSAKGLSRAKNVGLRYASNEIIGFPDDDCQFPPDTLEKAARFFAAHPEVGGLTGRSVAEDGKESNGRFGTEPGPVDKFNVWSRGIAYSIFLRRESIQGVWFDEDLGPGAGTPWGASDETDYLLRVMKKGTSLYYDPDLVVVHPQSVPPYGAKAMRRAYGYGRGLGYVLRRHGYPLRYKARWILRPLGGAALAFARLDPAAARYHWNALKGRARGMTEEGPAT